MAKITKTLITTQADAMGAAPSDERVAALAEAVEILVQATNEAAADVALEWEPARFLSVMDQTSER